MAYLEWSGALSLDFPLMDDTHREFVDLLGLAQRCPDEALLPSWLRLLDHTREHFAQEDRWMMSTRFAATNCHSLQHKVVLEAMAEGETLAAVGDLAALREMASELALWFPKHAQSMDAALALHLRRAAYDPETRLMNCPDAMYPELIRGCGSAACTDGKAVLA